MNILNTLNPRPVQRIHVMHRLKFFLDRKSLQTISRLSDLFWNMRMLARASRIVTGAAKLVSIKALLTELRWETLSSRRKKHKLILFL